MLYYLMTYRAGTSSHEQRTPELLVSLLVGFIACDHAGSLTGKHFGSQDARRFIVFKLLIKTAMESVVARV